MIPILEFVHFRHLILKLFVYNKLWLQFILFSVWSLSFCSKYTSAQNPRNNCIKHDTENLLSILNHSVSPTNYSNISFTSKNMSHYKNYDRCITWKFGSTYYSLQSTYFFAGRVIFLENEVTQRPNFDMSIIPYITLTFLCQFSVSQVFFSH